MIVLELQRSVQTGKEEEDQTHHAKVYIVIQEI